jgi:hypothetical protein
VSSDPRFPRTPLNGCSGCRLDFASVDAFDRHRIGCYAFTYSEGLDFDIPHEDGRRCMDADEMLDAGFELDDRGRWRLAAAAERVRIRFQNAA